MISFDPQGQLLLGCAVSLPMLPNVAMFTQGNVHLATQVCSL